MGISLPAEAIPQGGTVVSGSATISQSGNALKVVQTTDKAAINWRSYNISAAESVTYYQPSSQSITLNRVLGGSTSFIDGRLTANGQVWLSNPAGILFGPNARVNVGGLIATTHDLKVEEFNADRYRFKSDVQPSGIVENQGRITVAEAGLAAFVAPGVVNHGVITARLGEVTLASGNEFTVDLYGDQKINLALDNKVAKQVLGRDGKPLTALVKNDGQIFADGGRIQISAAAAKGIVDNVVSIGGIVQARSVEESNGEIVLSGEGGAVQVSGTLDASGRAAGRRGGTVTVTGNSVRVKTGARIDVSGATGGGQALIGGVFRGGKASQAEYDEYALRPARKPVPPAETANVEAEAVLTADALTSGNGGELIVWSDGATSVKGFLTARGGAGGGDGGFIETSGVQLDIRGINVSTNAKMGTSGTWLLDPNDFTIASSGGNMTGATLGGMLNNGSVVIETTGGNASTAVGGSSVTCSGSYGVSCAGSAGFGDIYVTDAVSWSGSNSLTLNAYKSIYVGIANNRATPSSSLTYSGSGTASLTLAAGRDIVVGPNVSIQATGSGKLNTIFQSNTTGNSWGGGGIAIDNASQIITKGGSIILGGGTCTVTGCTDYAQGLDNRSTDINTNDISLRYTGFGNSSPGALGSTGIALYNTVLNSMGGASDGIIVIKGKGSSGSDGSIFTGGGSWGIATANGTSINSGSASITLDGKSYATFVSYGDGIELGASPPPPGTSGTTITSTGTISISGDSSAATDVSGHARGLAIGTNAAISGGHIILSGIGGDGTCTDAANIEIDHTLATSLGTTIQSTGQIQINGVPYSVITTAAGLQGMSASGLYALGNGLSLSGTIYNGAFYAPIFSGTLDGLGNSVDGLTIRNSTGGNIGLFANLKNATVRNLGVTNFDIRTNSNDISYNTVAYQIGGLVGLVSGANTGQITTLSGDWTTGLISTNVQSKQALFFAGGLVGAQNSGRLVISNSYSTANVSSQQSESGKISLGGLVGNIGNVTIASPDTPDNGSNIQSAISHSYSTGSVISGGFGHGYGYYGTGGFIGSVFSSGVTVSDSFSWGNAVSSASFGGLAGWASGGTYTNFYTTQSGLGGGSRTANNVYFNDASNIHNLNTSGGTQLPTGFASSTWALGLLPTLKGLPAPQNLLYVKEVAITGVYGNLTLSYQIVDSTGTAITLGLGQFSSITGVSGTPQYSIDNSTPISSSPYQVSYLGGLALTGTGAANYRLSPFSSYTLYTITTEPVVTPPATPSPSPSSPPSSPSSPSPSPSPSPSTPAPSATPTPSPAPSPAPPPIPQAVLVPYVPTPTPPPVSPRGSDVSTTLTSLTNPVTQPTGTPATDTNVASLPPPAPGGEAPPTAGTSTSTSSDTSDTSSGIQGEGKLKTGLPPTVAAAASSVNPPSAPAGSGGVPPSAPPAPPVNTPAASPAPQQARTETAATPAAPQNQTTSPLAPAGGQSLAQAVDHTTGAVANTLAVAGTPPADAPSIAKTVVNAMAADIAAGTSPAAALANLQQKTASAAAQTAASTLPPTPQASVAVSLAQGGGQLSQAVDHALGGNAATSENRAVAMAAIQQAQAGGADLATALGHAGEAVAAAAQQRAASAVPMTADQHTVASLAGGSPEALASLVAGGGTFGTALAAQMAAGVSPAAALEQARAMTASAEAATKATTVPLTADQKSMASLAEGGAGLSSAVAALTAGMSGEQGAALTQALNARLAAGDSPA
ncbi:MAG: filamentous hemagglutinin N-terminal domain-containing protein, partial [Rhodospirillaceae bacterium]